MSESAMDKQVAGSHYTSMVIQPVEYCHKNGLGFCESAAVKYVSRWRAKGGIEDLKKAIHMIELLIEMEDGSEQQLVKIIQKNHLIIKEQAL